MKREWINGLEPKRVFEIFDELCQIPHGSGNEKAISDYVRDFCNHLGLETYQDDVYNLIVKKPATPGYEHCPIVVLQAHLDMVCQKKSGSTHDFTHDPIDVVVDGDDIHAKDTTLGADDGTGVAFAMCVLESKVLNHPALEVVLTVNEEAGMTGIRNLDFSRIQGRVILNLDCSDEGIVVGCAGTCVNQLSVPFSNDHYAFTEKAYCSITVQGLLGGHSGLMVASGRKNGNMVLGDILSELAEKIPFELLSMTGGIVDNAITRESSAIIALDASQIGIVQDFACSKQESLRKEMPQEPGIRLGCKMVPRPSVVGCGKSGTQNFLALLNLVPSGLLEMSSDVKGLAQLSANIGVVATEKDSMRLRIMTRARFAAGKQRMEVKVHQLCGLLNVGNEVVSNAPEWEYKPQSRLSTLIQKIFRREYHKDLLVEISHGGNECGSFFQHFPDADIVCSGTKITGAHTTEETVKVSTVKKEWNMLCKTLEGMKEY